MKETIKDLLSIASAIVAAILIGACMRQCQSPAQRPVPGHTMAGLHHDTITLTDTIRDTIRITQPVAATRVILRHDTVMLPRTDTIHDTVPVAVPIEQRIYTADEYQAWVSGYQPRLDSLHIYRTHFNTTQTVTTRQKPYGIAIQAGYGLTPKGLQPYIGLGIYLRLPP